MLVGTCWYRTQSKVNYWGVAVLIWCSLIELVAPERVTTFIPAEACMSQNSLPQTQREAWATLASDWKLLRPSSVWKHCARLSCATFSSSRLFPSGSDTRSTRSDMQEIHFLFWMQQLPLPAWRDQRSHAGWSPSWVLAGGNGLNPSMSSRLGSCSDVTVGDSTSWWRGLSPTPQ